MSNEASCTITDATVLLLNLDVHTKQSHKDCKHVKGFWEDLGYVVSHVNCKTLNQMRKQLDNFLMQKQTAIIIVILSYTPRKEHPTPLFHTSDDYDVRLKFLHEFIRIKSPAHTPKILLYQFYEEGYTGIRSLMPLLEVPSTMHSSLAQPLEIAPTELQNYLECYAIQPKHKWKNSKSIFIESLTKVHKAHPKVTEFQNFFELVSQRVHEKIPNGKSVFSSNLFESIHFTSELKQLEWSTKKSRASIFRTRIPDDDSKLPLSTPVPSSTASSSESEDPIIRRTLLPSPVIAQFRESQKPSESEFWSDPIAVNSVWSSDQSRQSSDQSKDSGYPSSRYLEPIFPHRSRTSLPGPYYTSRERTSHSPITHDNFIRREEYGTWLDDFPLVNEVRITNLEDFVIDIENSLSSAFSKIEVFRNLIKQNQFEALRREMCIKLFRILQSFNFRETLCTIAQDELDVPIASLHDVVALLQRFELCIHSGEGHYAMHHLHNALMCIESSEELAAKLKKLKMSAQHIWQYQNLLLQLKDLKSVTLRNIESTNKLNASQLMTIHGGIISVLDASVSFPEGSLSSNSNITIHLETVAPKLEEINGITLPASPVLKFSPCMNLAKLAKVTVTSWVRGGGDGADIQAVVCYRKGDAFEWEFDQDVTIGSDGKASFDIKKFCEYGLFLKAFMKCNFLIKSCLFVNAETKKLTNRLVLHCSTCQELLLHEMSEKGFKRLCSVDPILVTKIGDKVQVTISDIKDDQEHGNILETSAEITQRFLGGGEHEMQDYLLPRLCEEIVEFSHGINLLRGRTVEISVKHETDRVNLDSVNAPRSYTTAGIVVGAAGTTVMTGRGIDVQQFLRN